MSAVCKGLTFIRTPCYRSKHAMGIAQKERLIMSDSRNARIREIEKALRANEKKRTRNKAKATELDGEKRTLEAEGLGLLHDMEREGVEPHVRVMGRNWTASVDRRLSVPSGQRAKASAWLVAQGLPEFCGAPQCAKIRDHFADLGEQIPRTMARLMTTTERPYLSRKKA